ncbi:MAG: sensor histidine kinase [Flavobacteriales bacterium]|nr:sensor histidine kinase [Bacteroidota bacterium]MCB9241906.1 sensor histidine kinase [Flavobacteriales bacterium]
MTATRRYILGAFALFVLFFIYRFSFRDDFEILELVQISLNALGDILITSGIFSIFILTDRKLSKISVKWMHYTGSAGILIILYVLGVQVLKWTHRSVYLMTTGMSDHLQKIFDSLSYQIFDSYLVLAFGLIGFISLTIYGRWLHERTQKEAAIWERSQAELNFLKAQINPHFVFNTLNNIHFLVDDTNESARNMIQDFCDLLRYQLYETGNAEVLLSREVDYLKKYIQIQQVRKEDGFTVDFRADGITDQLIAPMLLIVPLENAFKYSPADADGQIGVTLSLENNHLTYRVVNNLSDKVTSSRTSGGLGIENLQKRLALIYGSNAAYTFTIHDGHGEGLLTINLGSNE